jgi:hypothetical protein
VHSVVKAFKSITTEYTDYREQTGIRIGCLQGVPPPKLYIT